MPIIPCFVLIIGSEEDLPSQPLFRQAVEP
jgi:hypothetical protein